MSAFDPKRTFNAPLIFVLESRGHTDNRAVHGHIVFVLSETRTFRIVHEQRLVTEHAAPGDVVADAEIVVDGGKRLPRKLAASAEAANVATRNKVQSGCKLVAQPQADQRIDPADTVGCRECSVGVAREIADIDGARERQASIGSLPPCARASENIDCGAGARRAGHSSAQLHRRPPVRQ